MNNEQTIAPSQKSELSEEQLDRIAGGYSLSVYSRLPIGRAPGYRPLTNQGTSPFTVRKTYGSLGYY